MKKVKDHCLQNKERTASNVGKVLLELTEKKPIEMEKTGCQDILLALVLHHRASSAEAMNQNMLDLVSGLVIRVVRSAYIADADCDIRQCFFLG